MGDVAPEQIDAPSAADGRADLYACGVVAYRMLTAQLPCRGHGVAEQPRAKRTQSALLRNDARPADAPPVNVELEALVAKMLDQVPRARFQAAGEALAAWQRLAPGHIGAKSRGLFP
jgi:serine/threonine protein kinase